MALTKGQQTRQKMINLMYLVFIAMLALNVPEEVLDGFDLVNENLNESIKTTDERNQQIYVDLNTSYVANPEKVGEWYNLAQGVRTKTDSIFNFIEKLKVDIAKYSDGDNADVNNLKSRDNLSAASEIMISPVGGQGKKLKEMLDEYRESMMTQIEDNGKKNIVRRTLSTQPSRRAAAGKSWIEASFENMPSIAAITYLTEIQVNVKQAEGEVLNNLVKNIDLKDVRVNELSAIVVPQSKMVMQGTPYRANIMLAAVDTTQRPRIVIDGKELPLEKNGFFEAGTGSTGTKKISGFVEVMGRSGELLRREFSDEYTVIQPMATIAPLLMDVVYAGISNPISISVPGVASQDVVASVVSGGTMTQSAGNWDARPAAAQIGQKFVISVSARMNGSLRPIAQKEFRIRRLPEPLPFISYKDQNGNTKVFRKGNLAKSVLLSVPGIQASIDDGILDIPFEVISFRTVFVDVMNNRTEEMSNGANFSQRQLDQMRGMTRGTRFFISGIKAKGPDGERDLYPMEVRIN